MKNSADKLAILQSVMNRLFNLLLAIVAVVLAMVCFFVLQEVVLTIGAHFIVQTVDSRVRSHYALVTIRNLWLLIGGMVLVGFYIGCLNTYFKAAGETKTRRLFLRILAVEIALIILSRLVVG